MKFDKIIIEGPNNVGKSTLINGLMEYLYNYGWELEHTSGLCPNDFDFYDSLLSNNIPTIFDRLHVGEMVYPSIFHRQSKLSQNEFEELLDKHDEHTLIIFLDADYEFIVQAACKKNEIFVFSETKEEKELFRQMYEFIKCNNSNCLKFKNHLCEDKNKHVKTILGILGYDLVN